VPRARLPKPVVVALKVDADTAAALDALPNKSAFIREALRARLDEACPVCGGTGRRPPGGTPLPGRRHHHSLPRARCRDCGREELIVAESEGRDRPSLAREVARLRLFLSFGDYFCGDCFDRSQECGRCGHRIPGRPAGRERHECSR
jgi:hypothetical protein